MLCLRRIGALLLLPLLAAGQDGPPPVLLINGFDLNAAATGNCALEPDSTGTFGRLQEFLEADGRTVVFFDNCEFGTPSIETLGQELGGVIRDIGRPVDLIGFSMGGLIIRSYLAGKSPDREGAFEPPADLPVRKAILVATPNFGSPLAAFATTGIQGPQLREGSRFTWELARWHQGEDDLRETDALAIVGDGGRGRAGDGVVALVSGSATSFGFSPERTRVLEACHNRPAFLLCDVREPMIDIDDEDHPTARIIRSFLADNDEWRTVGTPVTEHPSTEAGVYFAAADASGAIREDVGRVTAVPVDSLFAERNLGSGERGVYFSRSLAGAAYVLADESGATLANTNLTTGRTETVLAKDGPLAVRAIPAAALLDTLSLAANSLISIFGENLTPPDASFIASEVPLPTEFDGLSVLANGEPLGLLFANPTQINAYLPAGLSGLVRLTVRTTEGEHSLNVLITGSAPAVFALNGGGFGPAAAIDALSGAVNSPDEPAPIGGFVSIFLTGLGDATPTVTLGGVEQTVLFAGDAPGFFGLQQVNIQIVAGTPVGEAVELLLFAGGRRSNATSLTVAGPPGNP